ncbi:unnamed protein product [Protopolystoma xenopodis]|uniref:Uncharacterized protein n=1 Tax=Protopolystoma xenopodis TaxID=117903 RepID=A0A448WPW0_9PLAT|nr:unnamed protein product [Protopolystoma xenopodis]
MIESVAQSHESGSIRVQPVSSSKRHSRLVQSTGPSAIRAPLSVLPRHRRHVQPRHRQLLHSFMGCTTHIRDE